MVMAVTPSWKYFGLYSDFGDNFRGAEVSYGTAVASAAASGARDVAELLVPDSIGSPPAVGTYPRVLTFNGDGSSLSANLTYDNGWWGETPGVPFEPSYLLVEIQGPGAAEFVVGDSGQYSIYHYVSSDGGQTLHLRSDDELLLVGVTKIKIWRVSVFPGDPLPEPVYFWTAHVATREIP